MLLAYYGDDFTGSTDAMEALAKNGARTLLFLEPPSPGLLAEKFPDVQCIGVAGISRSLGPAAMERELQPVFDALSVLNPRLVHYKVCSTFDSSPDIGSIGKAMEIGRGVFGSGRYIPILAGVPELGRYTVFGHHFAASIGGVYRLDRHPVMSRHPVTPMDESDLMLHLAKQTDISIGLLSVLDLKLDPGDVDRLLEEKVSDGSGAVLFDVLDEPMLEQAGRLMWNETHRGPVFAVGSSGVEYALTSHWRSIGLIGEGAANRGVSGRVSASVSVPSGGGPGKAERLLVISGSCSPVTAGQIRYALQHGFTGIRAPVMELVDEAYAGQAQEALAQQVSEALREGKSVVVYTSTGPDDDTIGPLRERLISLGRDPSESGALLGRQLGQVARRLVLECGLRRLLAAGGDTSGYLVKELGIYALELLEPLVPGGPLCRAYAEEAGLDGLELSLKGGQVGPPEYFLQVLEGRQ
ncbi:four-carbon acid sugar kinase family protein [Paenibacillus piri]|uniref:Four-carbon acid sugar kinase family protein n=1 Tax=Paenibacillus piri TaxID=2547395 RepID=A0A4R5KA27_9BACL|nr:four-carbon acid sugar kinase family protein [Paenibacillus piri]